MSADRGYGAAAKILVVDDDRGLRELATKLLESSGLEVVTATTGEEAIELAERDPPALAVLDVRLPGVSGYEVCRALRQRFGDSLGVVFVSGERTEAYDRVAGLLLGADDYLAKPFAPDELLARVRRLLDRQPRLHRDGGLTVREREVLDLLASGLDQAEIAARLVISPKTASKHIERILGKLGVHSRAEAVALAFREELVTVR